MTPLVLIPGFMCDARLFGPQIKALGDGRRIVVPVPRERTISDMARAILNSLRGPICLGGLSMGGIVAMEMLRQAPERIERLALMDTTPLADAPANFDIRTRQIAEVKAGGLDRVMREELKPAYLFDISNKPELLALCMDMARALGPDVFEAQALALRDREDLTGALALAPPSTLILHGAEDRLCPPERHDLMQSRIHNSRRVVVQEAGHMPTLEQPDSVSDALKAWLSDET